jgi:hypothetical protein
MTPKKDRITGGGGDTRASWHEGRKGTGKGEGTEGAGEGSVLGGKRTGAHHERHRNSQKGAKEVWGPGAGIRRGGT